MKYEWIDIEAYESWNALKKHVEEMLVGFGDKFVINFAWLLTYNQAHSHYGLGKVSEELEDYSQASAHFQKSLKIYKESNDHYYRDMTLVSLFRIYQDTKDDNLLAKVAQCLNSTVGEVAQLFDQFNKST